MGHSPGAPLRFEESIDHFQTIDCHSSLFVPLLLRLVKSKELECNRELQYTLHLRYIALNLVALLLVFLAVPYCLKLSSDQGCDPDSRLL
jgi:hypothetical protein